MTGRPTPDDPATLLEDANLAPRHSLQAALDAVDGQPHPRIGWLAMRARSLKRDLWAEIAAATASAPPPDDAGLPALLAWEVAAARALPPEALDRTVLHGGQPLTVAELLRHSARLSADHAAEVAALARGPRLA